MAVETLPQNTTLDDLKDISVDEEMTYQTKQLIDELYNGAFDFPKDFSFYLHLSATIHPDIEALNKSFFTAYGKTIEQYRLDYRINKIKEFLVYTQLPLSEIAAKLDFQNTEHLVEALEQQTGLTPAFFKQIKRHREALRGVTSEPSYATEENGGS